MRIRGVIGTKWFPTMFSHTRTGGWINIPMLYCVMLLMENNIDPHFRICHLSENSFLFISPDTQEGNFLDLLYRSII